MAMDHIRIGEVGENLAAAYLLQHGYSILARRYRTKTGEIDIVAGKDACLVFVEVKTRRSVYWGRPAEAVTWHKQQKIMRTAQWYLQETGTIERECRFDVIEILIVPPAAVQYNHIMNAFCG
jgi:putative endonuclease